MVRMERVKYDRYVRAYLPICLPIHQMLGFSQLNAIRNGFRRSVSKLVYNRSSILLPPCVSSSIFSFPTSKCFLIVHNVNKVYSKHADK